MSIATTYQGMIDTYKQIQRIGQIAGWLHWDQMVNMPPKGLESRAEQLAFISGDIHRRITDPDFVGLLNELDFEKEQLDEDQQVNLREIKREVDKKIMVPQDLVEELTRHASKSHAAWERARQDSDFDQFAPHLERMLELKKQEAAAKGEPGQSAYDVMLDDFEIGMNEEKTAVILDDLRERLVPLVKKLIDQTPAGLPDLSGRSFSVPAQQEFARKLIGDIGFDFAGGRQDYSAHPFCIGELGDVRITTRAYENDPIPCLFGMLHEAGHALYEQGAHPEHSLTPLGSSVSLGVHESQSRFWENIIGRSRSFWKAYYPDFKKVFPKALDGVEMEGFYRYINRVEGSLIRVESDEATYNLHIILRFEIERDMFADRLAVKDLPEVWNQKMKQYLGIDVPDNAQGVLQDVHWAEGLMGYFPTYSLGNIFSAQIYEAACESLGDIPAMIEKREFAPLLDWLRTNIHRRGMRYGPEELIKRATGKAPSAEPLMRYLDGKFGDIYGF